MSSFICDPKHFNSAQEALYKLIIHKNNSFHISYALKESFLPLYDPNIHTYEDIEACLEQVFDTLRELNAVCVSLQYKHHYEGRLNKEIKESIQFVKTKTETVELTKHGLYNAMKCINYQIELEHLEEIRELTPEEKNAMTFLKEVIHDLAESIIYDLPDDTSNTWAIE